MIPEPEKATEAPAPEQLPTAGISEEILMKEVVDKLRNGGKHKLPMINDMEANAFIVALYDAKGAKAVESLVQRALTPNSKLLGYEKKLLEKHMVSNSDTLSSLNRRKFMHRMGTLAGGAGFITLGIKDIASRIPDETFNNMIARVSPAAAEVRKKGAAKDRRQGMEELTEFVKENAPQGKNTLDENDNFYKQMDLRIAQINKEKPHKPPHTNIFNEIIPYVAMFTFTGSSYLKAEGLAKEKDAMLSAAAGYVAHKVSALIEQEKLSSKSEEPQATR